MLGIYLKSILLSKTPLKPCRTQDCICKDIPSSKRTSSIDTTQDIHENLQLDTILLTKPQLCPNLLFTYLTTLMQKNGMHSEQLHIVFNIHLLDPGGLSEEHTRVPDNPTIHSIFSEIDIHDLSCLP